MCILERKKKKKKGKQSELFGLRPSMKKVDRKSVV